MRSFRWVRLQICVELIRGRFYPQALPRLAWESGYLGHNPCRDLVEPPDQLTDVRSVSLAISCTNPFNKNLRDIIAITGILDYSEAHLYSTQCTPWE